MNMINLLTRYAMTYLVVASFTLAADGNDACLQENLDGTSNPTALSADGRKYSVEKLQILASSGDTRARRQAIIALLNISDTQTVHKVLQELNSSSPIERKVAARMLVQDCRNPDILPALEGALFANEESNMELVHGEYLLPRQSVVAASAIRQIVASSDSFPLVTREWARSLDITEPGLLRETIRLWWRSNGQHIHRRDFDKVTPMSQETFILKSDKYLNANRQ